MKILLPLFFFLWLPVVSFAACFGGDSLRTCSDSSGNSYTVSRVGNSVYVNGSNPQTGSNWNQTSTKIGNSTYTNGNSASGAAWNQTSNTIGDSTYINGTDSHGNSYQKVCNSFGCL